MLHAVSFAFADSFNALLIGVLVAIGIMLPRGKYRKVAPLLVAGDWLGVFLLALVVMYVFVGLEDLVRAILHSPLFGLVLIVVAAGTAFLTWRSTPGSTGALVEKLLGPLRTPSVMTFATGFVLGVAQSITSVPFFSGIAVLAAGDFSAWSRYGGMIWYASVALSLPAAAALAIGQVRRHPHSRLGRWFSWAREHPETVSKAGGYVVALLLLVLGVIHL